MLDRSAASPLAATDPVYAPCGIHEIARRLGLKAGNERVIRARLDWLQAGHGFPPPLPSPRTNDRRYDRRAVEAWFDQLVPENLREAAFGQSLTSWASVLDARAANINQLGALQ